MNALYNHIDVSTTSAVPPSILPAAAVTDSGRIAKAKNGIKIRLIFISIVWQHIAVANAF